MTYTNMNFRRIPLEIAKPFRGKVVLLGMNQQEAIILLMQAVNNGTIDLEKLGRGKA